MELSTLMYSSEYYKIFKNTYLEEHLPTALSGAAYESAP